MRLTEISSSSNIHFRRWLSLLESKGIREHSQCMISGKKIVTEVLAQKTHKPFDLLTTSSENLPVNRSSLGQGQRVYILSAKLFKQLDILGTHSPLLVCNTPPVQDLNLELPPQGLEVICPLQDPQNLGALLRSAEAFGARTVALTETSANPFLPKALRAASGSTFRIPLSRIRIVSRTIAGPVVGLDVRGKRIDGFQWPQDLRLWVGEEGQGLSDQVSCTDKVSIPMQGGVESLNAVVAVSAAMFSFALSRPKT